MNAAFNTGMKQPNLRLLDKKTPLETPLTAGNLTMPREKLLFRILLVVSILMWIGIAASIIGIFYTLTLGLILWLGNGLFVAYLRSEGVEVKSDQMPELYNKYIAACKKLEIEKNPKLYIIQAGGLLNAFATRHASRDFVVLYSDMLESFGPESNEVMFILGHELGHIKRKHIAKQLMLCPGLFIPLLAPAYLRACESSCDRYGAFVAEDMNASINAMMAISGGKQLYQNMNPAAFAKQHFYERGFFISWHEIISGYPTLSKRVYDLLSIANNDLNAKRASRSFLAYVFGLFSLGRAGTYPLIFIVITCFIVVGILKFEQLENAAKEKVAQSAQYEAMIQRELKKLQQQYANSGNTDMSFEEYLTSLED